MKLNKIINNLYYCILLLVPVGWFLNGKYYFSRFESEGFGWIGLILSITLVVAASCFFSISEFLRNKKQKSHILFFIGYIILAIYSINCTTAGQYWDQQIKNKELNIEVVDKENDSYWINRYKEKIKDNEKELNDLREIEKASIENMSDMWYYRNTGKTIQERKKELKEEIAFYESELKKLTNKNNVSAKNQDNIQQSKTLYAFYSEKNKEKVQFVFQLILSIIIESIAQLSIFAYMKIKIILNEKKEDDKEEKIIIKKTELTQAELKHFSLFAFSGIVKKQTQYIESEETILRLIKGVAPSFTKDKYKIIIRQALRNGVLKIDGRYLAPESDFIDCNYFYKKMCEILGFTLTGK